VNAERRSVLSLDREVPLVSVDSSATSSPASIRIFADFEGRLPRVQTAQFDTMLTTIGAPPPWVRCADIEGCLDRLTRGIHANPSAVCMLARVLKMTELAPFEDALFVESLAYSALLDGAEFKTWLERRGDVQATWARDPVRFTRAADTVTLWLDDASNRNAYSSAMRDALAYALDSCLLDPTEPAVTIRAEGRTFCIGGALDEFGKTTDAMQSHDIRLEQSAAWRLHRLGERSTVVVQGAAIGSGVEMAAAAHHVRASSASWFHLPEIGMGLIPGAGGTVTVPRRIGRHRAFYLMVSGLRIRAQLALDWRLVDAIDDA
jgi:hypothetical protein